MSLVTDVLQGTGKLGKENIILKVGDLKRKLEDIKLEVHDNLKKRYLDFIPQYLKLDKFIEDIDDVTNEYESLRSQVEKEIRPHMMSSVVEFEDFIDDLKKVKKLKSAILDMISLHQLLENAKKALSKGSYLNSVHCLLELEKLVEKVDPNYKKNIAAISTLITEFIVTRESVIYQLETLWRQEIMIVNSSKNGKKTLSIKFNETTSKEEGKEILLALRLLKQLKPMLKEFGKKFLNEVCEMVLCRTVKVELAKTPELNIYIVNEHSPEPSKIFDLLKTVFKFLHDEFFHLPITSSDEESQQSVMNEFGNVISEEFNDLIIEKCLKMAIPKQSKQLETFRKEIHAAEEFCKFLQDLEFISSFGSNLQNFIYSVDTLPANKMAQDLLSRARSLMKKSLHKTVSVGYETPTDAIALKNGLNEMVNTQNGLSAATFLFPKCQISESVKDLISLLLVVKEEAKNIGPTHAFKLYYVARNICELYCCVVPTYHKNEIENIPQQTAIFHNNCMFLAHQLCTLGSLYQSDFQTEITMTFVDLVPEIKKLGSEAFLAQMRRQRHQLLQLLQEQQAFGSNILVDDGAVSAAEKAIRQCLYQLQLLKNVWAEILPVEVYFKSIGTLLNTCLEEIILRISSMEDIAAEAAGQLDSSFAILIKQSPDFFKVPAIDKTDSIHFYVKNWFKFQELQLILSASMREIVDRWASGKGPLAAHFKAAEVKHLIRALFQNTERRAAALAKIK
ncbi:centromere/kinetochore protein zw10 homolog [Argiope bruennichi]|uniref:Centromere/kinetochore protein zw10 like protein n=1 Tax=Argiope bruennichi TaxID=94029 RepID=A0A8T0E5Y5_ARGBR|nr:centromere/kinetochore protein zw10 homolog [Argiope bruennichi]KAF8766750.1 Centromere/kinetochore protein zw10 like protein [Argiope bruennichi]